MSVNKFPTFVPAANVVVQVLNDEAVLLDAKHGRYFSLNAVGARIWQLLTERLDEGSIAEQLAHEYDVSPDRALADVRSLILALSEARLIVSP